MRQRYRAANSPSSKQRRTAVGKLQIRPAFVQPKPAECEWYEAEVHRTAGEIALMSPERDEQKQKPISKNGPDDPLSSSLKPEETTIPFSQRLSCTIDEACEATSLGRTKLYELIGAGQLATTTVGRRRLVMVRELLSLLEANKST